MLLMESELEREVAEAIGHTVVVGDYGNSTIAALLDPDELLAAARAAIKAVGEWHAPY